jgi:diguanylate cyclase (GGDEF)-like protein
MPGPTAAPVVGTGPPGWLRRLDRWGHPAVHLLAVALTLLVAFLDWRTGHQLSFSIFYLLPVSLIAWRFGRRAGFAWAGLAAVGWLAIQMHAATDVAAGIHLWNAAVWLGFFLIVVAAIGALRRVWEVERALAGTDYVTGVLNGPAFHELVDRERSRMLRYNRPFTLAYMDIDQFKSVNDRLGRSAGDHVLRRVATSIRDNMRSMDTVARLGGDEFGILLPETGPGAAEVALRKVQLRLADAVADHAPGLTVSVGAVICVGAPESVDDLIRRADEIMYQVKNAGRNDLRCVVLDENFGIEAILQRS